MLQTIGKGALFGAIGGASIAVFSKLINDQKDPDRYDFGTPVDFMNEDTAQMSSDVAHIRETLADLKSLCIATDPKSKHTFTRIVHATDELVKHLIFLVTNEQEKRGTTLVKIGRCHEILNRQTKLLLEIYNKHLAKNSVMQMQADTDPQHISQIFHQACDNAVDNAVLNTNLTYLIG